MLFRHLWQLFFIGLLIVLVVSILFSFAGAKWVNLIVLVIGLGTALYYIIQKHFQLYKRGQITHLKFLRNILLDTLGLLLTIAAASYFGGLAGTRLGTSFGMWAGLIAGIAFAFLAAWGVRKLWVRLVVTQP